MSNTQIALVAASVAVALIVALWGITATYTNRLVEQFKLNASQSEINTTRLIEQFERRMNENASQFEKRMNERDEKLLAKLDAVEARLTGQIENLRLEVRSERESLRGDFERLTFRVEQLERRAA